MKTFLDLARMVDATLMMGVLGWGGGDSNVPWPCTHGRCYANDGSLTLHAWSMLRWWWVSWVGMGVMVTFLDLARMVDATLMMGVLGWGGGDGNVPWPCTHGRCYRWGGCKQCAHLSLQPHVNRTGTVNPGMLLLRCSSWFRRSSGKTCWYSYPFPMQIFHRLPRKMQ